MPAKAWRCTRRRPRPATALQSYRRRPPRDTASQSVEISERRGLATGASRTRITALPPGRNSASTHAGRLGAAPRDRPRPCRRSRQVSLKPSLQETAVPVVPNSFGIGFVLAEHRSRPADRSGRIGAELSCVTMTLSPARSSGGFGPAVNQLQVLRNQTAAAHADRRVLGAAIGDGDPHQDIVGVALAYSIVDIEIAVPVEDAGIDDLEFGSPPVAPRVLLQQGLGKFRLRIFVEHARVASRSASHRDSSRAP